MHQLYTVAGREADKRLLIGDKVVSSCAKLPHLVAVIAQDVGHPAGVLLRHGRTGNLLVHPPPDGRQISIRLHADGAR